MTKNRHFALIFIACASFLSTRAVAQVSREEVATRPATTLEISRVAVEPKELGSLSRESMTVSFSVSSPSRVALRIFDQWRRLIRTVDLGQLDAGDHAASWDGRDDAGELCRGHRFLYTLTARDERRNTAIHDPAERGAGQEVKPRKFVFDKETGRITYVLPKSAIVRIRIGLKEGPLMRTLVDWEPQVAGTHEISWDGKDASGQVNLAERANLNINLSAYALPPNCILVREDAAVASPELVNELPPTHPSGPPEEGMYLHWSCNPASCHEPRFTVSFPHDNRPKGGTMVVSGKVPLRIELDQRDRSLLLTRRFEIAFYLDGVFLFEEENGTSPFTYYWDAGNLPTGKHFLTVNVISYDDHIGTVTYLVTAGGGQ